MIAEEAERIYRILDEMRAQFIVFEGSSSKRFDAIDEHFAQLRLEIEGIGRRSELAAEKKTRTTIRRSSTKWGALAAIVVSRSSSARRSRS